MIQLDYAPKKTIKKNVIKMQIIYTSIHTYRDTKGWNSFQIRISDINVIISSKKQIIYLITSLDFELNSFNYLDASPRQERSKCPY